MRQIKSIFLFLGAALIGCGVSSCGNSSEPETTDEFAKGADISWVTEMEQRGQKFYNAAGEERDCFSLMKELGLNAVRLRVWVDPQEHDNWCNTEDMVAKAVRAKAQGMEVMVDFHYSDWWADPGQQHKPASWRGLDVEGLKKAVADHTTEVLQAVKAAGVTPKWVQVGNEIRPGMLWDEDAALSGAAYDVKACDVKESHTNSTEVRFRANFANLTEFINAGYDAVKTVFPDAIVIIHLDNGYDQALYSGFFDQLKENGGKWDMIGMSIYPYWTMLAESDYTAERTITDCITNINMVSDRYGCDVMIVETGMLCADDHGNLADETTLAEGYAQLSRLIKESQENTGGRCKGVFYWEPECRPGQYQLGAFTEDGRPTVIMDAFK